MNFKRINLIPFILLTIITLSSCKSTKVLSAWKAQQNVVDQFKTKNVLVIARTADNQARVAFENEITAALEASGIKATSSFTKFPKLNKEREISEERMKLVREIMEYEGYTGVVLTVVKDKSQTTTTSSSGVYVGAGYGAYYPGYYGGFYNYYSYPYAYGPYYSSFGGYVPVSSSTYTSTDYVLETVVYNLESKDEQAQLVAVVTTQLSDPKEAHKAAEAYVKEIVETLKNTANQQ